MPKRLDPEKGLPGLFESKKAQGSDMAFLVRGSKRVASRKPRPEPEPVKPRPARATKRAPVKEPAPPASPEIATTASDAVAPATSTSSGAFHRPVVVKVTPRPPAIDFEVEARERGQAEQLLAEAAPPCRVPEVEPRPPALSWREVPVFARCALEWTLFAARELVGIRSEG